ncbi:MAG: hypothetical protein LBP69_03600 [Treponema sp.]|nr:hypothetical protein [Treponema sp.]
MAPRPLSGASPVDTFTNCWGNGFRGGGWKDDGMTDSGLVNGSISLTVKELERQEEKTEEWEEDTEKRRKESEK